MKKTIKLIFICLLLSIAIHALATPPNMIDGLTYHDVVVGRGPVIRPGDTAVIEYSTHEYDPLQVNGKGKLIAKWPQTILIAGNAARGNYQFYGFELGIIGMHIGGTRLIYTPSVISTVDQSNNEIAIPHVYEVKASKIDNSYYKK